MGRSAFRSDNFLGTATTVYAQPRHAVNAALLRSRRD
jgi:hypothetical protein